LITDSSAYASSTIIGRFSFQTFTKQKLTVMHKAKLLLLCFLFVLGQQAHSRTIAISDTTALKAEVFFHGASIDLYKVETVKLDIAAWRLLYVKNRKILVRGFCQSSYKDQQLSWDRVSTVIMYLQKKGIPAGQFIFNYGDNSGPCELVSVTLAPGGEDGPASVAAPIPCYSKHKETRKLCKHHK
jgi:hypothetical protein